MFSEPSTGKYFRDMSTAFTAAHPDTQVDLIQLPAGQYVEKIFTEVQGGQVPDILPLFTTQMPQYMQLDLLEPLDPWLDKSIFKTKLLPLQRFAQKGGKNYGIVLTASSQGLLFNQQLLEKAKVDIPKTLDDLYSAADKIYKATGVFGYGVHTDTSAMLLSYVSCMQWILGNGSDFTKADGTITCNAKGTVEGFQQMMRFVNAPFVPKGLGWYQLREMFAEGKLAMLWDGPWDLGQVKTVNPEPVSVHRHGALPDQDARGDHRRRVLRNSAEGAEQASGVGLPRVRHQRRVAAPLDRGRGAGARDRDRADPGISPDQPWVPLRDRDRREIRNRVRVSAARLRDGGDNAADEGDRSRGRHLVRHQVAAGRDGRVPARARGVGEDAARWDATLTRVGGIRGWA